MTGSSNAIRHRRYSRSGVQPALNDLVYGQLAINFADGRLFTRIAGQNGQPDRVECIGTIVTALATNDDLILLRQWVDQSIGSEVEQLLEAIATKANSDHTHSVEAISGLSQALDNLVEDLGDRAFAIHTHSTSAIEGLAQLLEGKANQADLSALTQAFGDHSHAIPWDSPGAIGSATPNSAAFTTLTVRSGTSTAIVTDTTGGVRFPTRIGFYDKQPIGKPSVTGSRSSGAALGSILNALHNLGLITNNTSA